MKDIEWGTWTLPFGWAARGVWPTVAGSIDGGGGGTGSAADLVTCAKRSRDSTLLAAGDKFG